MQVLGMDAWMCKRCSRLMAMGFDTCTGCGWSRPVEGPEPATPRWVPESAGGPATGHQQPAAATPAPDLLRDAATIMTTRNTTHGDAVAQHACAAGMWSAWLSGRLGVPVELDAGDAALMMGLLKASRMAVGDRTQHDHYLDGAAYFAIAWAGVQGQ